jgi:hypothetical protein
MASLAEGKIDGKQPASEQRVRLDIIQPRPENGQIS